jgi:hypothetical protein
VKKKEETRSQLAIQENKRRGKWHERINRGIKSHCERNMSGTRWKSKKTKERKGKGVPKVNGRESEVQKKEIMTNTRTESE